MDENNLIENINSVKHYIDLTKQQFSTYEDIIIQLEKSNKELEKKNDELTTINKELENKILKLENKRKCALKQIRLIVNDTNIVNNAKILK